MNVMLLTSTIDPRVKAGVETYNEYLKKIFPQMKIISNDNVKPSKFNWFSPLKEPLKALQVDKFVKKNAEKLKPDLVITNGMYGWNLKEKEVNCPIMNVSHGTFAGLAGNAIKKFSLEYLRTRFIYAFFEKQSAKNATLVISNSHLTRELNKKYYGIESVTVHNPVDIRTFKPVKKEIARKKLGLNAVKKICLFVGRQEYQKGFDLFEKIAELKPDIDFISITFPKTISKVKNIKSVSVKDKEELSLYYAAADLVIFPSRFEGFGFVPVEALACNTPVISTITGVIKEINIKGLNKINTTKIAEWDREIDKILKQKFSQNTDVFVREQFGYEKFKQNILRLTGDLTKN